MTRPSLYSVPAAAVRPRQTVELRITGDQVAIHALPADVDADGADGQRLLATHPRASGRGQWVVDDSHWAGLPDGRRRVVTLDSPAGPAEPPTAPAEPGPLETLLARSHAAIPVAARPLSAYDTAAGLQTQTQGRAQGGERR